MSEHLTKSEFLEKLYEQATTARSPLHADPLPSPEDYCNNHRNLDGIQRRAKDSGIFVGDKTGPENPVVAFIDQIAKSGPPLLLTLSLDALKEKAWEYYQKNSS
ncbi:MAG: hypothetical protein ACYC6X_03895 [Minisyncoccota bacterium]